MKKNASMLAVALSLSLSLSLLAGSTVAQDASPASAAAPSDTLKTIKDRGAIVLGVREASGSMSYSLGDGQYAGFHVELCQRVVAAIEKQVGRKVEVRYQNVTPLNRIPLVINGTVDLECGVTTNNVTRQRDVAFAVTAYVEEVRMAVKAQSNISSISQLAQKRVGTVSGTTSVQALRQHERASGADFQEVFGKDQPDTFLLLETDRIDAFVMDSQILAGLIARSRQPSDYRIVGEVLSVEPLALMMRRNDPAFKKLVDDTLKGMMKSGEMARVYDKWFMQPIPPTQIKINLPASESTQAAWANPNDKPKEEYRVK